MKLKKYTIIIAILFTANMTGQNNRSPRIPFAATFVKKHLEQVGLKSVQWDSFYTLCSKLDEDMRKLRKETNVTKDLIKKRDEVYKEMMKDSKLNKSEYLEEMGRRLNLDKNRLRGFSEAIVLKQKFNKEVLKLLNDEQKIKFIELKKKKWK